MESNLLVLIVVLVTLGHGSSVLPSKAPSCIRSEQILSGISKLEANRSEASSNLIGAHQPLFTNLVKLATEYVFDLEPKTQQNLSEIFGAGTLLEYQRALDYSLDSIPFALRKRCNDLETTRTAVHEGIAAGVVTAGPVVALALAGDYSKNRAAIEAYHTQLSNGVASWVIEMYDFLRNCVNTTNPDTLAAIATAQNGSVAGMKGAVNAFFDVIILLNVAITTGNKSVRLIFDVEECRARLNVALRDEVDREFGLLEGFYANYCSKKSGLVSSLAAIQYTAIVSSYTAGQLVPTFADEVIYQVNRIGLGFFDDRKDVLARIDVAKAKMITQLVTGHDYYLDLLVTLHLKDSSAVEKARRPVHDILIEIVVTGLKFIKVASDQSKTNSEIKADMNITNNEVRRLLGNYARIISGLIGKGQISSPELKSEFSTIRSQAVGYGDKYVQLARKEAEILAEFSRKNGTSGPHAISAIRAFESKGSFIFANYVNSWFDALRLLFFAIRNTLTKIQPKS